jgi:hypothetical protein
VPPAPAPLVADSQHSDEPSEGSTACVDSLASTHISHQIPTSKNINWKPIITHAVEKERRKRAADAAKLIAKNEARKAAKDRQNIQEKKSPLIVSKLTQIIVYSYYVKRYLKFVNLLASYFFFIIHSSC